MPGIEDDSAPTLDSPEHHAAGAQAGVVLLIVLWWLTLVIFLAMQVTAGTRAALMISTNIRGRAIAEAQADGALNEAIFRVLAQQWKADGTMHVVAGPQAAAEVRIEDEGGKVDPNVAPVVVTQMLLRQCGAAPQVAAELAKAIYRWRSIDLQRSPNGGEDLRYRLAGLGYLPPHARFVSFDELGLVLGMTSELLACLEPHISLYSLAVPSLQTTADPVIRRALVEAYPDDPPVSPSVQDTVVIRITAVAAQTGGSGRFRRVAVIRLAPAEADQHLLYKILAWQASAR